MQGYLSKVNLKFSKDKGVGRKISSEDPTKKMTENAKKPKIASQSKKKHYIKPLPGGSNGKKTEIWRKIALLSFYLLYLYHV